MTSSSVRVRHWPNGPEPGVRWSLLICTDGSKGTWDANADTARLARRRKVEQREAARRLGARGEVCFLDEVDGELDATMQLRSRVARVIRELRPEVVLAHTRGSAGRLHPDHRAAGFLACDAVVAAEIRISSLSTASPITGPRRCCCSM